MKRSRVACLTFCVVLALLVGIFIGLAVFFLLPREPTVSFDRIEPRLMTLDAGPTINVRFTIFLKVGNPNWIGITVKKLLLDILYDGDDVGDVEVNDIEIPVRDNVTVPVDTALDSVASISSLTFLKMLAEYSTEQQLTFFFTGNVTIPVLTRDFLIPISFNQTIRQSDVSSSSAPA